MTLDNVTFSLVIAQDLVNKDDQFPVDLDLAWQWLGYATKQKAQNKLLNNFESGLDYYLTQTVKVQIEGKRRVSRPYLQIMLTIDCFKSLGMMSGTDQGKQIRKYFLQCEKVVKQVIPQQNETIEMLKLQNEVLGKELSLRQLDHTMLTLHGKEIVLALRGYNDQIVKVEQVVTEIVDVQKGTSEKILTADQLKKEVKKQTGQNLKSQSDFIKELRKSGRDDLIVAVDRRVTAEYVIPDKLDEAIAVVYSNNKQRLLGE